MLLWYMPFTRATGRIHERRSTGKKLGRIYTRHKTLGQKHTFGEVDLELSVVRSRFITLFGRGQNFEIKHSFHTAPLAEALEAQDAIDRVASGGEGKEEAKGFVDEYSARAGEAMRFAYESGFSEICELDLAEIRQRIEATFGLER